MALNQGTKWEMPNAQLAMFDHEMIEHSELTNVSEWLPWSALMH